MTKAKLVLESGLSFTGELFGATDTKGWSGEVVFNTAMTGYQEILTDPSYRGQFVCMTYPLIGNYGINEEDMESRDIFLSGMIVKELSRITSNWRSSKSLDAFMKERGVVGIKGVDTRALTLHLRDHGAMKGVIVPLETPHEEAVQKAKNSRGVAGQDLVQEVAAEAPYEWNSQGEYHVIAVDSGIKLNILRLLEEHGCRITVVPVTYSADGILGLHPDGVFLSNGPGDPEQVDYLTDTVKKMIGKIPIFGICLGHQIISRALGANTFKLKFGHHGANHPVMDLDTRKVEITSQNHGFAVDTETLPKHARVTHVNLNDGTCEGIEHVEYPIFSVQYHPEAAPGPHDSSYLFQRFIQRMKEYQHA